MVRSADTQRKKHPVIGMDREQQDVVRAMASKLVPVPKVNNPRGNSTQDVMLSHNEIEKMTRSIQQDIKDTDATYQMLPDVELAEQILVGCILSPKDMSSTDTLFSADQQLFSSDLTRPLLNVVQTHFKKNYKIDDDLNAILEEVLFTRGARVYLVLPENNLDLLINSGLNERVSTEHFDDVVRNIRMQQPLGFLGAPRGNGVKVSLEGYGSDLEEKIVVSGGPFKTQFVLPGVSITDNFNELKITPVKARSRRHRINTLLKQQRETLNASMESISTRGMKAEDIDALYSRGKSPKAIPTDAVVPQEFMKRSSVGHPLVMQLPMESVIPVFTPGDPQDHVGYFILIDPTGRPVRGEGNNEFYGQMRNAFNSATASGAGEETSRIVQQTKDAFLGSTNFNQASDEQMQMIQDAYCGIIENDLQNRLRNGLYGDNFEFDLTPQVYTMMLSRSLAAKQTRLLYVPAELVTYIAFDYNKYGIGQTLLNRGKLLSAMRAVLLFAEVQQGVRNAIGRKRVGISVDENDPDPQKTISDIQTLILESAYRGFPVGAQDPGLIMDYLNRAGFDFQIEANGDNFPNTKVQWDDYQTTQQGGNNELSDRLRRMHISSFGLNPDTVDPTQSPDFAVSVVNNNLMLTRRVIKYQKLLRGFLSRFVQTYTRHSSILRQKLADELEGNKTNLADELKNLSVEEIVDAFIDSIVVSLPEPDTTKIDQQQTMFSQYTALLDMALEAYITEDLFRAEDLKANPEAINQAIRIVRARFQRHWLEHNNVMPELDVLTSLNDKDKSEFDLLDEQKSLWSSLGEAIRRYIKNIQKQQRGWNNLEEMADEEEESLAQTQAVAESGEETNWDDEGSSFETEPESEENPSETTAGDDPLEGQELPNPALGDDDANTESPTNNNSDTGSNRQQ